MNFEQARKHLREGDKILFMQGGLKRAGRFLGEEILPDNRQGLKVELPEIDLGDGHKATTVLTIAENESFAFEKENPLKADLITVHEIQLNAEREAELAKGAETSIGRVDLTGNSLALLNAAALRALLAQHTEEEFREEWTLHDNTVHQINDADLMIQVAKEAGDAVSAIYEDIRNKKQALRKMTKDELEKFEV